MLLKNRSKREQPALKDPFRVCVVCKNDYKAVSPLQKTCSLECRRIHYAPMQTKFKEMHPDAMKEYNKNRLAKNPNVWKDKQRRERNGILEALGGRCIVCGASNKNWLHVDYIPTMRNSKYRHPRHFKWVMENLKDFRILCANHHYELTITGKIEGTDISQ